MNKILFEDFKQILSYIKNEDSLYGTSWLITGATGMIGSYFLSFLNWLNENRLGKSLKITATYRGDLQDCQNNIYHLLSNKCIDFTKIDFSNEFNLPNKNYNYVIHAASNAAPNKYLKDPIGTINTNVNAIQTMLKAFKDSTRLRMFLYFSSGEVYGNPDLNNIPTPENYIGLTDHLSNRACYVESKKFTETLCINYFRQYNLPIKIIRPVHVYGPGFRGDDSRVWADFIIKAAHDKNIEILGDGKARRGFCYLADAVLQIITVILFGDFGEVYNIGNDCHYSIKELAEIVKLQSGNKINVLIKNQLPDYLVGSPQISCPSIKKVKSLAPLNFTSLEDGILKSIKWYKDLV